MEIRKVDRSVSELLDGPGIQLSELAANIQQLHIFFSLLIPDMSHEERQLLDEALIRTYNSKGITHDNASLEDPANPGCYRAVSYTHLFLFYRTLQLRKLPHLISPY